MTWLQRPLEEVADFSLGKMLDQKKNRGEMMAYLANANVRWGDFDLDNLREMRFEPRDLDRYGLQYGDIVMCEGGEPGRCAIWKDQVPDMMFQKALHRIRPHPGLDSRFLFYGFLNKGRKDELSGFFTGSTIKHLPREKLAKVLINVPPLPIQQRVADILSAYDDLIENNRRRIALLEEAARLLYREWFVYFRFPGHERVKIIDGLPKGWELLPASRAIEVNPKTPRSVDGLINYVPMSALSESGMIIDQVSIEKRRKPTSVRFQNGDTLFARITPCLENGKTGFVQFLEQDEVACGSTEFIVLRGGRVSSYFVYLTSRQRGFRENAIRSMIGSSGRQRVQSSCFDRYFLAVPPDGVVAQFDDTVGEMFQQIEKLDQQNQRLSEARDLLLPRLMNGEIAV